MLLPTLFVNERQRDKPLTNADYLGWSIWLFGFVLEVLADSQKMVFRSDPKNKVNSLSLLYLPDSCLRLGKIYRYWPLAIFETPELFRWNLSLAWLIHLFVAYVNRLRAFLWHSLTRLHHPASLLCQWNPIVRKASDATVRQQSGVSYLSKWNTDSYSFRQLSSHLK